VRFQYHPDAARELIRSVEYYEGKSPGLGAEFLDEMESVIARIMRYPDSGTLITAESKRILLRRFPFGIVYEAREDLLTITAVMHLRRNPDYWKSRK